MAGSIHMKTARLLIDLCCLLVAAGAVLFANFKIAAVRRAAREQEEIALRAAGMRPATIDGKIDVAAVGAPLKQEVRRIRKEVRAADTSADVHDVVRWKVKDVALPAGSPSPSLGSPVSIDLIGREARLVTRNGNWLAVGDVEIWRSSPKPRVLIDRRQIEFDLHHVAPAAASPAVPRHVLSAGVLVGAGRSSPFIEFSFPVGTGRLRPVVGAAPFGQDRVAWAGLSLSW